MDAKEIEVLKKYVLIVANVIPLPLCKRIIKEFADGPWEATRVGNGSLSEIRTCDVIGISLPNVLAIKPVWKEIDSELFKCAGNAMAAYKAKYPRLEVQQDTGYELLRYKAKQRYGEHTDTFLTHPRSISCSFALNEDFTGGEWSMFESGIKFRAPAGSAVMFPSNFMYPHEILPVKKGIRYSIITWFN